MNYILKIKHNGEPVESEHSTYNQAMVVLLDHLEYWQTHHRMYCNAQILRADSEIDRTVLASYNTVDGWLDVS